ncbi:MipA/OmpV family protein [Martelella alba]|uniref:MipA/OmpV family protein n=1 Tax=Martelella alba TaxID=2590451 RepID=A0ABY2SI87_9HYPH|nr:MipA/OmpV family protein [Martelella alba]TKI04482.1 MipA/OmpV family protein [Martelella alba]
MKFLTRLLLCLLALLPLYGMAADISLGAAGFASVSPYAVTRGDRSVWPVLNYDDDHWYIQGDDAGRYLINDDRNELKLKVFYFDQSFKASRGNNAALRRLNDRRATAMAGMSYQRTTFLGAFHIQVAGDILNNSQGITANIAYLNLMKWGMLTMIPEIGLDGANAQQSRYYYGISSAESRRSGLDTYRPSANATPYISLTADYQFTPLWDTYASARSNFLPAEVRNSPMVNRNRTYAFSVGINYNF